MRNWGPHVHSHGTITRTLQRNLIGFQSSIASSVWADTVTVPRGQREREQDSHLRRSKDGVILPELLPAWKYQQPIGLDAAAHTTLAVYEI